MSRFKTLGKNSLLILLGNLGSKVITFFMLPFYTTWLTVAEYGTVDLISTCVAFIVPIVSIGISQAVFVLPKNTTLDKQKSYFSTALVFAIVAFTAIYLLYQLLFFFLGKGICNGILCNYIDFIYLIAFIQFLNFFLSQFARSINNVSAFAFSGAIFALSLASLGFLIIPNNGLFGYLIAYFFSVTASLVFLLFKSKAYSYFSLKLLSSKRLNEMIKFSLPLAPNSIIFLIIALVNRPVILKYLGVEANGVFAVVNTFPKLLNMFYGIFLYSWQISALDNYRDKNYKFFYNTTLNSLVFGVSLICLILSFFGKQILGVIADDKYIHAWVYIPILVIPVFFSILVGIIGVDFLVYKKTKYSFYSSIWAGAAAVVFNFILIPKFGLYGACFAIVISNAVLLVSRMIFSRSINNINSYFKHFITLLILSSFSFVVVYQKQNILSLVCLLISVSLLIFMNRNLFSFFRSKIKSLIPFN